ncbi:hypothetical protein [Leptothoe sp. PORK10 BA2]|uniref:hypothetical protein n=1 Tax=Leptothoe sp. PORK10 BA2 TaxID=3110254 RepID=UPI002B1ED76B|nr:hypothetical protein [Leptothoe sp. PORK10 BA2]MEA5466813.1 hypothetical protein [Leptothoe sp. PORK10 BA2]
MPTEQMTIYVSPQLKKAIQQLATTEEKSMNTIVVAALELAIAEWSAKTSA